MMAAFVKILGQLRTRSLKQRYNLIEQYVLRIYHLEVKESRTLILFFLKKISEKLLILIDIKKRRIGGCLISQEHGQRR